MDASRIPEELKKRRQWVCWRYESDKQGKRTKVPLTIGGYGADSTDPADWYTFDDVQQAQEANGFDGIGFVFSNQDDLVGIDLDDCIDGEGGITDWALEILERFDGTYAEISPSKTGVKIWCRGTKLDNATSQAKVESGQIECYSHGRYFAVTGEIYDGSAITNRQSALNWLCDKYLRPVERPAPIQRPAPVQLTPLTKRAAEYMAECEPASQGDRNSKAFRIAGQLHSITDDMGNRLSQDEILSYVRSWNATCKPPMDEAEVERCVQNGITKGTARQDKPPEEKVREQFQGVVDLSKFLSGSHDDEQGLPDEEFAESMVPKAGLLREVFDFYWNTAYKRANVFGLAVAVSTCETLFGRRIASHTDLRTNDYNVIVAGTASGKEACESTVLKLFSAGMSKVTGYPNRKFLIPPDVQSGNALIREISEKLCAIWVCDEFGKHLEIILDKKNGNSHAKQIGTHLLKMYGKSNSTYEGASHSAGNKSAVNQPHLCLLGLTTAGIFESLTQSQIEDGLFGRLTFWPVQQRPKRNRGMRVTDVPEDLAKRIGEWIEFLPGVSDEIPIPVRIPMSAQALERWEHHADEIDERMDEEAEVRAAVWGRVAARSMKLAIVHRAARWGDAVDCIGSAFVDLVDVNWGIRLSNWLARISCQLVNESIPDSRAYHAKQLIVKALQEQGTKPQQWFTRTFRRFTAGDIRSAAKQLEAEGQIEIRQITDGKAGRPKIEYALTGGVS